MIPETKPLTIYDKGKSIPDSIGQLAPVGENGRNPCVTCRVEIIVKSPDWTDFSIKHDRQDIPPQVFPTFLRQVAGAIEKQFLNAEVAS